MAVAPVDKAALIAYLLEEMFLDAQKTLYVGDKWEDGEAATANGMPFIAVDWGYGQWAEATMPSGWCLCRNAENCLELFGAGLP
jgi:phosphoglycolate phosphatase-like HAD superfamily hydrolase